MKETDKTKAETAIAKKLGKNTSFITDKKKSVKGYSAEDVLWLRYTFRKILGFPIGDIIEVKGKEDNNADANSGQQDQDQSPVLRRLLLAQEELRLAIEELKVAPPSSKTDTGGKEDFLLAHGKLKRNESKKGTKKQD